MRPLTPKEHKLVELKAKGVKHSKAYSEAYDTKASPETARREAHKILTKPPVKQALEQMLVRKNITLDRALTPIDKGLSATKQNQFTGEIEEDISLQLKASDRALKLLGVSEGNTASLHLHLHQQRDKYNL